MDPRPAPRPPSRAVCEAFGAGAVAPVDGGQGTTYGNAAVVLKPVIDVAQAEWLSGVLDALPERDDLRVIRPVPSTSGAWVVDGWGAFHRLDGEPRTGAWRETVDVSRRFHELVDSVPRSDALDDTDPWAIGHRFAWGEQSLDIPEALVEHVARLCAWRRPLDLPEQFAHGDLLHNVLFHETLPPAVIDVSPCWRPARYADAIVVSDAIWWDGAPRSAVETIADGEGLQLLVRATLFRMAAAVVLREDDPDGLAAEQPAYERVVSALAPKFT